MVKTLVAALVFGGLSLPCRAGPTIYSFVDERGVLHLTDVPDDPRYRQIDSAERLKPAPSVAKVKPRPYDALIENSARAFGVDSALIHAVISVESGYNAHAVSRRGAAGLMQLMATTAAQYGVSDRFDPVQNVRAGTQHLRELLALFGNDLELTLAAYNAGAAAVERHGRKIPPYRETLDYVPKVLRAYRSTPALLSTP